MNMETAIVERIRDNFLVSNDDDSYIKISANQVERITKKVPDVEETEVAILLATIGAARVLHIGKSNSYKKVDEKTERDTIVYLLQNYDIDTLNSIFEEMKYYEIKKVLESDNPMMVLRELI